MLGPISFNESVVLGHFCALALLWITQSLWGPLFEFGVGDAATSFISSSTPAITIAIMLFIAPAERPVRPNHWIHFSSSRLNGALWSQGSRPGKELRRCLDWKTAVTLPWGKSHRPTSATRAPRDSICPIHSAPRPNALKKQACCVLQGLSCYLEADLPLLMVWASRAFLPGLVASSTFSNVGHRSWSCWWFAPS